ncbi:inositol transporter-like SP family MFS transporter [Streptomyces sp. SAI-144]|uniref:MFS transporter n=1 Tax=unclassified Streptomyces TaxID=2593676 RepID=UPI002474B22A|nr:MULTISPECIES: MFS transporter [unclassified Streptomyces]MDH6432176.1 inositol transporter-like SP family MFS transporter [Streptomyces sp. SAI-144]MDH6492464.1 inositol transporter-like SP family MFS transporter [Streptomyces sp. SAI-127]
MARTSPAPNQPEPPIEKRLWKVATLSGMASYLDAALIVSIGVNLAIYRDAYDMGVWMAGAISAIVTICIAVGSLVGGRLADVFGRRRLYNLDILCYALGAVIITLAPDDITLLVGVLLAGLAAGADLPTSLAVVSDASPDHARGRLIAFTQVMWMLGIIVVVFVGFALSDTGMLGARLITGHLAVAALVTWHLRSRLELATGPDPAQDQVPTEKPAEQQGVALRNVWTRAALVPMLATFAFYVTWGLGANTMGQFTTYLLVTVSGASQSVATGINLACLPIGLLLTLAFVRIADGPRRDRMFYVATLVQIAAFAIGTLTLGAIVGFLVFYVLYQLSYPFAGEANYKVWSQLTLPADTRGTTQGITYAVSRGVFAGVAFVTPALLDRSPSLLLWVITGCMALSALAGLYIVRVLIPRVSPVATAPADVKVART